MHLGSIYELVWFELHCALHDSSKRKLSKSEPAQSHPGSVPCLDDFIGTGHEGGGVNLACKLLRKALSKRKKKNLTPLQKEVALAMTRALFFCCCSSRPPWNYLARANNPAGHHNGKSAFKQHNYKGGARCYWTLRFFFVPFFCFCSLLTSTIGRERGKRVSFFVSLYDPVQRTKVLAGLGVVL